MTTHTAPQQFQGTTGVIRNRDKKEPVRIITGGGGLASSAIPSPRVSIVIPTRDRPQLLKKCLSRITPQLDEVVGGVEVLVVDDGGGTAAPGVPTDDRIRLIPGFGEGPARARNRGISAARGDIVAMTDDDVLVGPGWLKAIVSSLDSRPDAVGVRGPVTSPPIDVLYEASVEDLIGGSYLTCNIAYRRNNLELSGGFYPGFPYAAHEDRDLGWRMELLGPVLFDTQMTAQHPPRALSIREIVRRGKFVEAGWILYLRHPDKRPPLFSTRWAPLLENLRQWVKWGSDPAITKHRPARFLRIAILAIGQLSVASRVTLTEWRRIQKETTDTGQPQRLSRSYDMDSDLAVNDPKSEIRIAYMGPTPNEEAGAVAGCAWSIVKALSERGHPIDCYLVASEDGTPPECLASLSGVRVVSASSKWRYARWYSNNSVTKMITGQANIALLRRRLLTLMAEQHGMAPYDIRFQFSTIESFGSAAQMQRLPPLVVQPEVHAAGELEWMRRERDLAERCEGRLKPLLVRLWLQMRSRRQRRDIRTASTVIALSRVFGAHLVADYGVEPDRVAIVPNPIDLDTFRPDYNNAPSVPPVNIAVVGRLSVRKGLDQIAALSHRLHDMSGIIAINVVGGYALWSDYSGLLSDLNPDVACYLGSMERGDLARWLRSQDMLVQAAKYEPFGLTVGEALASGVPVVVTTEVGAGEEVSSLCCTRVAIDNLDELESAIRDMAARMLGSEARLIRTTSRMEAERLWNPERIAVLIETAITALTSRSDHG